MTSLKFDFLGEYEAICETALSRESGPYVWWGWLMKKKTEGQKSRDIVPLKCGMMKLTFHMLCRTACYL
jgi:hypothetical protein